VVGDCLILGPQRGHAAIEVLFFERSLSFFPSFLEFAHNFTGESLGYSYRCLDPFGYSVLLRAPYLSAGKVETLMSQSSNHFFLVLVFAVLISFYEVRGIFLVLGGVFFSSLSLYFLRSKGLRTFFCSLLSVFNAGSLIMVLLN